MFPAIFISVQITGNPIPQLAFGSNLVGQDISLLAKLDEIVTMLGFNAFTAGSKSTTDLLFITAALMVGTAGLPHVIVRFFTVPKVSDARKSAGWALLFIAILYTTAPAVGSLARLNLINTIQTGEVAGMIVGIVFTLSYIIYFKFMHLELNNADNWWFGISPEGIGSLGMIFNFVVALVVSKVTDEPPQEIQDLVESIRIPKEV